MEEKQTLNLGIDNDEIDDIYRITQLGRFDPSSSRATGTDREIIKAITAIASGDNTYYGWRQR